MAQNLFVGGINFRTNDDGLKTYFEQIGEVARATIATERETGRSRGFGFVEFVDEANNQKAIDELNGTELDGKQLTVNIARPKEDRPKGNFNRGGYGGNGGGGSFRRSSW